MDRVDIIRGDRLVHTELPDSLDASITWTDPAPLAGEAWYYARVTQANGGFAWSTPTWVTTAEGAEDAGDLPLWCDVIWPPAPADRGPDARASHLSMRRGCLARTRSGLRTACRLAGLRITEGATCCFGVAMGAIGAPLHVHLYDEFPAPRLYVSRGWSDFGWGPNGGPPDKLPWPEPTGEWA